MAAPAVTPSSATPVPAVVATAPAPAHPLRDPRFRRLWTGSAVSLFGDQFYLVALPWVVFQLTGSAVAMATIMMAAAIPRAVLMLMGGAISDRFSCRKIMMATASARGVLVTAIGALLALHSLRMWELYLLSFGFGVADAFAMPASQTYLPFLVSRERLVPANSVFQTTAQLITIVGPAPAGIAVKAFGAAWAFFLDAISFVFIPAALVALPDPPLPPVGVRQSVWHSIFEGIRYVRRDVPLSSLMLTATVVNFCLAGPAGVGLPYLAAKKFGSPTAYAALVSCVAAGGLLGAFAAGLWKPRRRGFLILGSCAILGLCIGSIGLLPRLWLIGVILVLMGIAAGITNIHIAAWCQQRVETAVRGRVMSVLMFAAIGLLPVSLAVAGVVAQWSMKLLFLFAGAGTLAVTAAAAMHRSVREIA